MNYTSFEQSKHLLELGLGPETSDMVYTMTNGLNTPFIRLETIDELGESDVVCWSVGALMDTMPVVPKIGLMPYKPFLVHTPDKYYCRCALYDTDMHDSAINACYDMVVWLLQNNYIKTESL